MEFISGYHMLLEHSYLDWLRTDYEKVYREGEDQSYAVRKPIKVAKYNILIQN